jgi:hypothetical protein
MRKECHFVYDIFVHWEGADSKVKFMTVCRAEGFGLLLANDCDRITVLTPCKQKHSLKLSAYINGTAVLCLIREVVVNLAQAGSKTIFG